MDNLIHVNMDAVMRDGVNAVSARDIHAWLEIKKDFTNWIKQQIRIGGFKERFDWEKLTLQGELSKTGQSKIDYMLSLNMAKHISMMSRVPKGKEVRDYFISVEKKCKLLLRRQAISEWIVARTNGKIVRIEQTDIIKRFVEYAIAQGSQNAKNYYTNITTMEYKALFFLEEGLGKPKNLRDMLSSFQISQLIVADRIVAKALDEGMEMKMYYKDIYKMARDKVKDFAELIGKSPVLDNSLELIGHNQPPLLLEGALK